MTSPAHHFDMVVNDPAPENECISESAVAAINYMEYQFSFYHSLAKKPPRTYKVSKILISRLIALNHDGFIVRTICEI